MRCIIFFLLVLGSGLVNVALAVPDASIIHQNLQETKNNGSLDAATKSTTIHNLQNILDLLNRRDKYIENAKKYKQIIDDFPKLSASLRRQITPQQNIEKIPASNLSKGQIEQELLQTSSQILEENQILQQQQDLSREISESLLLLPQQLTIARQTLYENNRRLQSQKAATTPAEQAKLWVIEAEKEANKAKVEELELAQLSANNRQELAKLRASFSQQHLTQLDEYVQALRNKLNDMRQNEAQQALQQTLQAEQNKNLPENITHQLNINRDLSAVLNDQTSQMAEIANQQRLISNQILVVNQALTTLNEQSQWLDASPLLGEALRAQIARLPDPPPIRKIDNQIGELRVQRLQYEEHLNRLTTEREHLLNAQNLTKDQHDLLASQLKIQLKLYSSILSGSDSLILEIAKLKVANTQLVNSLTEVREAAHRYLFWSADINPITAHYPVQVITDLFRLLSFDTLGQLSKALIMVMTSKESLLPVLGALFLVVVSTSSRRHYHDFQLRASQKIGKVTQDSFTLTLRCVMWSILVASPIPVLWAALGYGLQTAWQWPTAVAIGDGITATLPLLWVFMISASFASSNGLFIAHFRWPAAKVAQVMRYYSLSVGVIIPLIMLLNSLDNFDDRQFVSSLGRLCFVLICIALTIVTNTLRGTGLPLYYDRQGNSDNLINRLLWDLMLAIPPIAAIASCLGYLATSQVLLARMETSMAIWFVLLIAYHIIRRWMLIQRRRIEFDRARQKRAERLTIRSRSAQDEDGQNSVENSEWIDEPVVDLDTISAQSLRLVRSLLALVAVISLIILWSELNSAFAFLENIPLWNVSTTSQGVESTESIKLGPVLIAILVLIITLQLVRNMPALLELAILQHLSLTPGTGYAITTLTKYILMIIGVIVGLTMLGIGWAKLQFVVTALGLGLGFGLQQIFANFVSGLIILFEKPIRIGDTVTIRNLTGTVSKINIRATTITDWDRKEIIVPNQAFITEQFVNWSLSDSITRVVLNIPVPAYVSSELVTSLLRKAACKCQHVLTNPAPEVYLVELNQGIQLFELRLFAAEMGHRMPLRNDIHKLILQEFAEHNIEMPYPPMQVRLEHIGKKSAQSVNYQSGEL